MTVPAAPPSTILQAVRFILLGIGVLFALSSLATPALALAAGMALALTIGNPSPLWTGIAGSLLLKAAVVGLGLGIPLNTLLRAGADGLGYTALLILGVFAVGLLLGRWFAVERTLSVLITAGTSICGGSAIATLGPAIGASREVMSVSLATVFILNAVALYLFPPIGHLLDLSQHQFAVWAALAIHDTSSVVGAAASYGPQALAEATILKLARALWIVPLALVVPLLLRRTATVAVAGPERPPMPWFIGFFVLAAIARAVAPPAALPWFDWGASAARTALVVTLFLIGASLTRSRIRAVGARPFLMGSLLWVVVASGTLMAVLWGVRG